MEFERVHLEQCPCGNMTEFTEEGFNAEYFEPLCTVCESSGETPTDYRSPVMKVVN